MRSESDRIHEILKTDTDVIALVAVDNIFPLIADQGTQLPWINYHVSEDPTYSKEGKLEIIVSIGIYAKDYNAAAEIADKVRDAFLKDATPEQFFYLNGSPNYSEERLISVNQNYKFKNE